MLQMFRDLSNQTLQLTSKDRAAIRRGIYSLQQCLIHEPEKFDRGS